MSGHTYRTLLIAQSPEDLWRIARAHGLKGSRAHHYTLVNRLERNLSQKSSLLKAWDSLSQEARALWALIAILGQHATRARLEDMLKSLGVSREEKGKVRIGNHSLDSLLQRLFEVGLAFPYRVYWLGRSIVLAEYGGLWMIPAEAYKELKENVREALRPWLRIAPTFTRVVSTHPLAVSHDLIFLWGTAWRKPLRLLKSGGLSKRDRDVLTEVAMQRRDAVPQGDTVSQWYFQIICEVLVHLGVLAVKDNNALARLDASGRLPSLWRESHDAICCKAWDALPHIRLVPPVPEALHLALRVYAGWNLDSTWWPHFWNRLRNTARQEEVVDVAIGTLWVWVTERLSDKAMVPDDPEYRYPDELKTGEKESEAVRLLAHTLYWLGMADLLYHEDRLVGVRLAPAREIWRGSRSSSSDTGAWQFVVQPSFQVLSMGPTPPEPLALAEAIAERKKVERVVVEYTLDRQRFLRSLQAGLDGEYALARLNALTTSPLPQNVRRSLEEWVAELERVKIYAHGVLVETTEPEVLKRVLKRAPFKGRAIRLDDRHVLLPADLATSLRAALIAEGIYPTQVSGPQEELTASVEIDEEGYIRPKQPTVGLYLAGTLRRFAVPADDGTWRLTPESVREAARVMGTDELLNLLNQLTGGEVPRTLKQQIYLWTAYFGRVRAERVVLLHFPRPEALKAIRSFAGLSRVIRPVPFAPDAGVAQVKEQDVPKVLKRLRELGIEVEGEGL